MGLYRDGEAEIVLKLGLIEALCSLRFLLLSQKLIFTPSKQRKRKIGSYAQAAKTTKFFVFFVFFCEVILNIRLDRTVLRKLRCRLT